VQAPLIVVPIAIELTLLITSIAPLAFNKRFSTRPNFGIAMWLSSFLLAFMSTLIALGVSVWSIFDTWHALELHTRPLWQTVLFSFAPWIVLGLAGISMALFVQKFEPVLEMRQESEIQQKLPSEHLCDFHGIEARVLNLPVWFAFTSGSGRKATIFVSSKVVSSLDDQELDALLWHEYAHAKFRHNSIKTIVRLIRHMGGIVLASRVLSVEIERLCELSADRYAAGKTDEQVLRSVRKNFE
jgi:Zn-dependent protease with chaperone function